MELNYRVTMKLEELYKKCRTAFFNFGLQQGAIIKIVGLNFSLKYDGLMERLELVNEREQAPSNVVMLNFLNNYDVVEKTTLGHFNVLN